MQEKIKPALEKIAIAKERVSQAKEEYYKICEDIFEDSLREIFQNNPNLNILQYIGYTPSFNDGDPCYHRNDVYVGAYDFDYPEDLVEDFNLPVDLEKEENLNGEISKETRSQLYQFEDYLQHKYTTNYKVTVWRNSSQEISFRHDDYECGH